MIVTRREFARLLEMLAARGVLQGAAPALACLQIVEAQQPAPRPPVLAPTITPKNFPSAFETILNTYNGFMILS
jgi:hypothetical protein